MLRLVRSVRNTFAPINQIPPEVFSLIPDYWGDEHTEQDLIVLTHVSRGWREVFTSRSSLWTYLDCKDVDQTRVYVERSGSLPLEISLRKSKDTSYCDDALIVAVPHIGRLGSLTICAPPDTLSDLLNHFHFPAPLLTELKVVLNPRGPGPDPVIPNTLFPGHLSPLRKLSLSGVVTHLPWRNLSNLTVFEFRHPPRAMGPLFAAQLLNFFESTPLLNRISLHDLIPVCFNDPHGRVVPLLHLKELIIHKLPAHSTFIKHLSIQTASLVDLDFDFFTDSTPIPACLANNFNNLCNITTIYLLLNDYKRMRLIGPSGELHMFGTWATTNRSPFVAEHQFFWSLREFDLSKTQRLTVSNFSFSPGKEIEKSPIFQTLLLMKNLRTLTLVDVNNLSFIRSLNPRRNKSRIILCPELEELILRVERRDWLYLQELLEMALKRAKNFAKLASITIITPDEICSKEVFRLKRCISRVEYQLDVGLSHLDLIHNVSDWDELRYSSESDEDDEDDEDEGSSDW